jgi:hypothetical protein
MIMDIKEIIAMAIEADLLHIPQGHEDLPLQNPTFGTMLKLQKFAELTLKRASLSANEQDAELVKAAKAVVDRWHTPSWKDAPHTAEFINRLENALKDKP